MRELMEQMTSARPGDRENDQLARFLDEIGTTLSVREHYLEALLRLEYQRHTEYWEPPCIAPLLDDEDDKEPEDDDETEDDDLEDMRQRDFMEWISRILFDKQDY